MPACEEGDSRAAALSCARGHVPREVITGGRGGARNPLYTLYFPTAPARNPGLELQTRGKAEPL